MPAAIAIDSFEQGAPHLRSADFEGPFRSNGTAARDLSVLLLDLYELANRTGIGEFESGFCRILSRLLPFDAAWTGVATNLQSGPVLHSSFTWHLPETFFGDWVEIREIDPLVLRTRGVYGRAVSISVVDPDVPPRFRDWAVKYGLAQLMVTAALDRRFGLTTFLSVYRRALDRPFTTEDARKVEDIIPHLAAALTINRSFHLARAGEVASSHVPARAICDAFGTVHQADKLFDARLQEEWPSHTHRTLPQPLVDWLRAGASKVFPGEHVIVHCLPTAGLFQLELRTRSKLERLSPRELMVIRYYGEGLSHKEVARRMDISPTTVRHYLRCAYRKLDMHDKIEIPRLLASFKSVEEDVP